ncbi:MAG TPA: hypothetical protein DCP28_06730 [Cytophagales bacterium]|nr:hypothetical protein [Cytophagales bacterium]
MQFFEIVLASFCLFGILYLLFTRRTQRVWALMGGLLLLTQFIWEGIRWQLAPTQGVLIILMLTHALLLKSRRWIHYLTSCLGILLVAISTWACYALPVFSLPEPTGPYHVGVYDFAILDSTRNEEITADPDDLRAFTVRAWYPASSEGESPVPYLDQTTRKGFERKYGLPNGTFGYLDHVHPHSYADAPLAHGAFPIILFAPGLYTPANGYHALVEELTSQGFFVFHINPTYETMASRFADGREVYFDTEYANATAWSEAMGQAVNTFENAPSDSVRNAAAMHMTEIYSGSDQVERWAADMLTVLHRLEAWNTDPNSPWYRSLQTNHVAMLGHSLGGAAAVEASLYTHQIQAAINLDGSQWGNVATHGLQVPTLFLSSDWLEGHMDVNRYIYSSPHSAPFYPITLSQTGHSIFSDIPLMIRIPQLNEAGILAPTAAYKTINELILAFLKKHVLKEKDNNLDSLLLSSPYLEHREVYQRD